jgi:hypothetical protein
MAPSPSRYQNILARGALYDVSLMQESVRVETYKQCDASYR